MRKELILLITFCLLSLASVFAQKITVEGYAYEENDRGFLNEVKITILDKNSKAVRAEAFSNMDGFFKVELPHETDFILRASKKVFKNNEQEFTTKGTPPDKKVFLKVEMGRKPGYLFDVTMSERRLEMEPVDAIKGAKIEVYNNTKKEETLVLENYEHPNFNVTFEQGNHYTVMIRKKGFFNKRMEAYVNVAGCILCFDGVGDVRPGVSDVMTKNNTMGTLLANVELDRAKLNKRIKIENIYYDLAKWNIRLDAAEELDKLLITLKDNPSIIVEIGSHTDCRGKDPYNLDLSQKRADAAVAYLVKNGIDKKRIQAKGYGETKLINECDDGVRCSERRHQLNRRTELKIVGFLDNDPYSAMSLKQIMEEENFQKMLEEVQNQEVIEVKAGEDLPDEIKNAKKNNSPKSKKQNNENGDFPQEDERGKLSGQDESSLPFNENNLSAEQAGNTSTKVESTEKSTSEESTNTILTDSDVKIIGNPNNRKSKKVISGSDIEILIKTESKTNPNSKIIKEKPVSVKNTARKLNSIPIKYTGYKVEVLSANAQLPNSHELFSQFGNLMLEETKEGTFAYLLGDFKEKKDAERFLENIVVGRYPAAKVISYFSGRRVSK